jgi:hypothetical protein
MSRICASTKAFFFMLALADWARTNSSGVCAPSPIGRVALM